MRTLVQKILLAIISNGLAVYIVTQIFPSRFDIISSPEWLGFVVVGFIFGLINGVLKPILKVLSLPLIFLTLGLFLFVLNAFILWIVVLLTSTVFEPLGIAIIITGGFVSYLLVGISLGLVNAVLHWALRK